MNEPDSVDVPILEPRLTAAEKDEAARIGYFLDQWKTLHVRGLVGDSAFEAVMAEYTEKRAVIERGGLYQAALFEAGKLIGIDPKCALDWAEHARRIAPERPDAWSLAIDLLRRLHRDDQAVRLCEEAAERFPELRARLEELRAKQAADAARTPNELALARLIAKLRQAHAGRQDSAAIEICNEILAIEPGHREATVYLAFANQRAGRLDEALTLYKRLHELEPENDVWTQWVQNIQARVKQQALAAPARAKADPPRVPVATASVPIASEATDAGASADPSPAPALSWASFSAEFLQDHRQKLILCLAVLLIVVSSNILAYHIWGPELWSPIGKSALALVYTATFAAFGAGLTRWGASRAGRMMLITTLIVVPANFMLAGQMRLLLDWNGYNLSLLAFDAVALYLLIRGVVAALGLKRGGAFLSAALFAVSALNATTARGVGFGWGLTTLILPGLVFLASVIWLNTRFLAGTEEEQRDFAYVVLGVLTLAFLSGVIRTGVYILRPMHPCFFAVPVMFLALACVQTAHHLAKVAEDRRWFLMVRFAGLVLSALAFALALSRPPIPSPVLSGNTLATAILGLLLYATSLRAYRQPAYLYLSFAALFVGYFGAFFFTADLVKQFEESVRHFLHYRDKLPLPFKANNGLVFNALLAILAIHFRRRWDEPRLSRHCHYIGLPLSITACVLSTFEPTAAVICLSGYTVLYAIAVWLFAAPIVAYLACAAMVGACYFVSTLVPGMTIGTQAIGAAVLGLFFWLVTQLEKLAHADRSFRMPVLGAATALVAAAMAGAMGSLTTQGDLLNPIVAFCLAALLCLLINLEVPTAALAYLAAINSNFAYAAFAQYAGTRWRWMPPVALHGAVAGASALVFAWLGRGLIILGERGRRGGIFAPPLFPIALVQAVLAILLALYQIVEGDLRLSTGELFWIGNALALASATFVAVAVFAYRRIGVTYPGVIAGACAAAAWMLAALLGTRIEPLPGAFGLALAAQSVVLYLLWRAIEPTASAKLYRVPMLSTAIAAASLSWLIAGASWPNYGYLGLTFAVGALALVAITREVPRGILAYQAIAGGFGAWFCAFEFVNQGEFTSPATYALLFNAFALALLLTAEATSWLTLHSGVHDREFSMGVPSRAILFSAALPNAVLIVSIGNSILALLLPSDSERIVPMLLVAVSFLWATRFRRDRPLVYFGLAHVTASAMYAASSRVGWASLGLGLGWQALTLSIVAVVAAGLGAWLRRREKPALYTTACLNFAAVLAVIVFIVAIDARVVSRAAFPVGAIALLVGAATAIILAIVWRRAFATVGGVLSVVAATYVTLFSVGTPDPANAYILGLAAAAEAIFFWCAGFACRRTLASEWDGVFAVPLFASAIVLATLAPVAGYSSPLVMAIVALSFLLAIKSFPRAEWLYPALAAAGCAIYFAWLRDLPSEYVIAGTVGGAYALWALGVIAGRFSPSMNRRLALGELAFEFPFFNAAIAAGLGAAGLRVLETVNHAVPWTAEASLPLSLGVLCLLMVKGYAHRGWIHAAVGLASFSLVMALAPRISTPLAWLLVGMVLANTWYLVMRGAARIEAPWCRRLGVAGQGYSAVFGLWSIGFFAAAALIVAGLVLLSTVTTVFLLTPVFDLSALGGWWSILFALLLAAIYVAVAGPRLESDVILMSVYLVFALIVWWLGAPASPLVVRFGLVEAAYFPLATAVVALATVALGHTVAPRVGRNPAALFGAIHEERARRLESLAVQVGFGLAIIAVVFTLGRVSLTTSGTLILVTATLGILVITRDVLSAAYVGSAAWCAAGVFLALRGSHWQGLANPGDEIVLGAAGGTAALFGLWVAAGWLRRLGTRMAAALAVEQIALTCAFAALIAVVFPTGEPSALGNLGTLIGVGVLLAIVLLQVLLAHRWRAEWLVYGAQATLLAAYFEYRTAFTLSAAADAALLTLCGYLDLGIAEVMQRLKLKLYARPTLYFSLVMPLIPLVLASRDLRLDDVDLFYLFTAATFYGVACYKMQWKTLGYAAAVLYNAFLWLLWSQVGFKLADHSQFFLIPVGLSAILLAEVNRQEFGQQVVNVIRVVGLMVIYASLALPIWQFASFGAWLTLLLLSLVGIFVGIGLRAQSFLWLGLVCFVLDVVYQLGRIGIENAVAKWGIMLALGILLVLFVALNEKVRIVGTVRQYLDEVRRWE